MEFVLPSPLGTQATLTAQQPARPAPNPTRVEKTPSSGKSRADAHNTQDHGNTRPLSEKLLKDVYSPPPDPDQPVGPPPTFQLNVLEMERQLQQRLAQIEFSRALESDRASLPAPDNSDQVLEEPAKSPPEHPD
ncbi:hypothetical protein SAMN04488030_3190 [Aliiroseovarius halocynthiae]|uniref:Uncharacterized protein n=1 Tax=Aliiroseovarius halocynthiae TaxID=985055 RepID=A0A545SM32_9RHOB|nr:hypothetical protein [Aliiroseovarius halocynthiae]TQV66021.1 hypothetical protein FIL88_14705 [Aliiroseovarius halocynthiae]SMR83275.1 hypothetical protein SAMN04488030_3190 [Aliiroseovarius halocynthiae]